MASISQFFYQRPTCVLARSPRGRGQKYKDTTPDTCSITHTDITWKTKTLTHLLVEYCVVNIAYFKTWETYHIKIHYLSQPNHNYITREIARTCYYHIQVLKPLGWTSGINLSKFDLKFLCLSNIYNHILILRMRWKEF